MKKYSQFTHKFELGDKVICTELSSEETFNKIGVIEEIRKNSNGYYYRVIINNNAVIGSDEAHLIPYDPQTHYPDLQEYLHTQAYGQFLLTGKISRFYLLNNKLYFLRDNKWTTYLQIFKFKTSIQDRKYFNLFQSFLKNNINLEKRVLLRIGFREDEVKELREFIKTNTNPNIRS